MRKPWVYLGLSVVVSAILYGGLSHYFRDFSQPTAIDPPVQATLSYAEFIQQVETDKINDVMLVSDRTAALVQQGNTRLRVNLPPDNKLIDTLTRNGVNITVSPPPQAEQHWTRLLLSLMLPIGVALLGGFIVFLGLMAWAGG